ncbi:MAG: hypothetical protein COU07_04210, partial [Candidatus Harrisonbacteria bacterium CG10_big_fil_rev_8_21_14_0_10_40_38]
MNNLTNIIKQALIRTAAAGLTLIPAGYVLAADQKIIESEVLDEGVDRYTLTKSGSAVPAAPQHQKCNEEKDSKNDYWLVTENGKKTWKRSPPGKTKPLKNVNLVGQNWLNDKCSGEDANLPQIQPAAQRTNSASQYDPSKHACGTKTKAKVYGATFNLETGRCLKPKDAAAAGFNSKEGLDNKVLFKAVGQIGCPPAQKCYGATLIAALPVSTAADKPPK